MKTWKILTITGVTIVAAALLVSTAAAMGPWGWGGYGGMMGGYRYNNTPYGTEPNNQYYQPVYPFQFGGGCHGRYGGYGAKAPYVSNGAPLNITTAKIIAQNYVHQPTTQT